jgi:thiopeptide-type bacteriocin biosynthesis protein
MTKFHWRNKILSQNKQLQFMPTLFARAPVYSYNRYKETTIADLLKDRYYLAALKISSQDVYDQLEKAGFDEAGISHRLKCTLRRYFNRMCFRPTPFGINSTVCLANWGKGPTLQLQQEISVVVQPGFPQLLEVISAINKKVTVQGHYETNPSIYDCGNQLRYIRFSEEDPLKREYHIESVQCSAYLAVVFKTCTRPTSLNKITLALYDNFGGTDEDRTAFVRQLVEAQLLLPVFQAHITGDLTDSLNRTYPGASPTARKEKVSLSGVRNIDLSRFKKNDYINAERKVEGSVPVTFQQAIKDGLEGLDALLLPKPSADIKTFCERFRKKFEGQAVPLLHALDPELGVGFAGMGTSTIQPVFGVADKPVFRPNWPEYSQVHALLLRKWQQTPQSILLQKEDLDELEDKKYPLPYPPTTSVLFRIAGNQLFLEQAGGASGTSLPGRFSAISEDLYHHAATIAKLEETENPDVVFAEVAHFSDSRIANIERRRHLYQYEIPVCTGSSLPKAQQIPLNDLYVYVREGSVILWSRKLAKRVIPRHSSAYNYTRSNFAVFRFLCELQNDRFNTLGHFHLEQYFPRLTFYPRITYKNTILQMATWKIKTDGYAHLRHSQDRSVKVAAMQEMVAVHKLPRYISVDAQDNQLIFDTDSDDCLELLAYSFKPGTLTVKEFPFADETSVVVDSERSPYINQFVACLYHQGKLLKPDAPDAIAQLSKFMPMEEWVYYKLYCHPVRANELIARIDQCIIARLKETGLPHNWFFIRYADPDFHIRLRVATSKENFSTINQYIHDALKPMFASGLISDMQIAGYEREWERYPQTIIQDVEQSFQCSSELVADYLANTDTNESQTEHYRFAFQSISLLVLAYGFETEDLMHNFKQTYLAFEKEFSISHEALNHKLRELKAIGIFEDITTGSIGNDQGLWQRFERSHQQIAANKTTGWPKERKLRLMNDLIHMHLNRFFVTNARRQELMVYYCLFKNYQAMKARQQTA